MQALFTPLPVKLHTESFKLPLHYFKKNFQNQFGLNGFKHQFYEALFIRWQKGMLRCYHKVERNSNKPLIWISHSIIHIECVFANLIGLLLSSYWYCILSWFCFFFFLFCLPIFSNQINHQHAGRMYIYARYVVNTLSSKGGK